MSIQDLVFTVTPAEAGLRLDDFLIGSLEKQLGPGNSTVSKSKVRRLIMAGAVRLGSQTCRIPTQQMNRGERIQVRLDETKLLAEKSPGDISFELDASRVLFEDEWLIVVDKPAGLPTEATIVASRDHLQAAVQRYLARQMPIAPANTPYVGLHHRLDRETSGVILFSKKRDANAALHEAFAKHVARKTYLALCPAHQIPARLPRITLKAGNSFQIENCLNRISAKSAPAKWGVVKTGGDQATTDFTVQHVMTHGTLIEARPITGRTHQIRVHLSSIGLPILGDNLYGGSMRLINQVVPRVMLHAARLIIPHPISGSELQVEAPQPADFTLCLRLMAQNRH
jgi:23S rRNA pseudouridine1911/1915/1917 synthase